MWDYTPLVTDAAVAAIKAHGGLRAIAISHPHFYTNMAEWSRSSAACRSTSTRTTASTSWTRRRHPLLVRRNAGPRGGVTLIRCGGHFTGTTALHWAGGAGGKGALFTGDTVMVVPDTRWVSFMCSYPNLIPVNAATVRRITAA